MRRKQIVFTDARCTMQGYPEDVETGKGLGGFVLTLEQGGKHTAIVPMPLAPALNLAHAIIQTAKEAGYSNAKVEVADASVLRRLDIPRGKR